MIEYLLQIHIYMCVYISPKKTFPKICFVCIKGKHQNQFVVAFTMHPKLFSGEEEMNLFQNFLCCANAVKVNQVQFVYSCFIFDCCKSRSKKNLL